VQAVLIKSARDQVEEAFARALATYASPNVLVEIVFKAEAPAILLDLSPGILPGDIASFVVGACLISRWTRDLALLDMLLEYLVTRRGEGVFQVILTRVRQHVDPNPSVYDSAWLIGQRPFFDRRDFRQRVRLLIEANGRPILRVSAADTTTIRYFADTDHGSSGSPVCDDRRPVPGQGRGLRELRNPDPGRPRRHSRQRPARSRRDRRRAIRLGRGTF
jgi:hypothetical protein